MKKKIKMRRYREGDLVDEDSPESQKVYRSDLSEVSDEERMPRSMAPVMRKAAQTETARRSAVQAREESAPDTSRSPSMTESPRNAIVGDGRYLDYGNIKRGAIRRERSDEEKARNEENTQMLGGALATALSAGRVGSGVYGAQKMANRIRDISQTAKAQEMTAAEAARAARIRARQETSRASRAAKKEDEVKPKHSLTKTADKEASAARRPRHAVLAAQSKELTPSQAAMADRIRARQEMFGSGRAAREFAEAGGMKRGGKVKRYSSGGSVSSASKRADGIAQRGKTRGRIF